MPAPVSAAQSSSCGSDADAAISTYETPMHASDGAPDHLRPLRSTRRRVDGTWREGYKHMEGGVQTHGGRGISTWREEYKHM